MSQWHYHSILQLHGIQSLSTHTKVGRVWIHNFYTILSSSCRLKYYPNILITKLNYKNYYNTKGKTEAHNVSSLDINLIVTNRNIFIGSTFITTHPQLKVVSSGSVTIVSVKPWKTRSSTTSCFVRTTTLTIPEWIRCV